MKNALQFLLVWLLPVGLFAQQGDNNQQKALVFTHVTVIDATGAPAKTDMTVVVKGDRIEALGKTGKLIVPQNTQVVDATGEFIIPGLWDMHVHPHEEKDYLALFIANGITGVRVMWGYPKHHRWREEISAGELIGPRMVIASPVIDGPGDARGYGFTIVRNEEEGRQIVRKSKAEGADFIKVYNNLSRDTYFAIVDESKKLGTPFAGHLPFSVSGVEASNAGQQSIEHPRSVMMPCSTIGEKEIAGRFLENFPGVNPVRSIEKARSMFKIMSDINYDERKAAELFALFVKNNTWSCPTLTVTHGLMFCDEEHIANDPRLKYMPLYAQDGLNPENNAFAALATGEWRAEFRKLCEKQLAIVGAMRNAGVGLLAGTDTWMPGLDLQDELALLVQAGLSPMEALQTATYNPAKFFGKLDSMGTIEQGKIADLVLLEANPLQDIRNTQKIAAVVVGGKLFEKTTLQKMLAQVEAARLHHAAASGNIEHVKLLISEGADVNARDQRGCTPALTALYGRALAVTDLLLEKGGDTATPYMAAYTGDLRGIKKLLEKNTPVESWEGLTLLHAAAAGGHTDVVEFLITKGFETTATTENDDSPPLHYAVLGDHPKVAEILLANGADVDMKRKDGQTPLHTAAEQGHNDIVTLLIDQGADVNANTTKTGAGTPLHQAAGEGHIDTVKLLIANRANVNSKNNYGGTPLHWAAVEGYTNVVELLLNKGADVNAKNKDDDTPLNFASNAGHTEIVELLRKHGAKE